MSLTLGQKLFWSLPTFLLVVGCAETGRQFQYEAVAGISQGMERSEVVKEHLINAFGCAEMAA
jgi:hypothetical protein